MQIIILGMHRAGTSACARLINMMGAELGPAQLIGPPAPDNPKGFWERTDIRGINDQLLESIGCRWDDVAAFNAERLRQAAPQAQVERIAQAIYELDTHRPWLLKDPRLCLTMPLWRPLLEVPVCVLPHRDPCEVARSLRARNGLSLIHGVALWERYSLAALEFSTGLPRVEASYQALVADPVGFARGLFERLCEAGVAGLRMPSEREIDGFVEAELRHQRSTEEQAAELLNPRQRALAAALGDGSALLWGPGAVPALSTGGAEILAQVHDQRRAAAAAEAALADAEGQAAALQTRLDDVVSERDGIQAELAQAAAQAQAFSAELEAARGRLETQATEREGALKESAALRTDLKDALKESAALRTDLKDALKESVALRADLERSGHVRRELKARLKQTRRTLKTRTAAMERLQGQGDALSAEVERLREEVHLRLDRLEGDSAALRIAEAAQERLASLTMVLAANRGDDTTALAVTIRETQARLAEKDTQLHELRTALEAARAEVEQQAGRIAVLTDELAAAQTARDEALAQPAAAPGASSPELDRLEAQLVSIAERLDRPDAPVAEDQRDEQLAFLYGELALLRDWMNAIDQCFSATLESWRWRVGHGAVSLAERVLMRSPAMLAADHIRQVLEQFRQWSQHARSWSAVPSTAMRAPGQRSLPAAPRLESERVVGAGRVGPSSQGLATYDLICLANIDWDARYQRPQQLASQFARHGHRVFYLIASRHLPADDSQGFRATEVERNIWEVELAAAQAPDRYGTVLDTNTLSSFLGSVSALRSAFEIVDAVVDVHLAFWTPLALRLRETWGWPVLYDCMDEWEDFPGIGRPLLQAEQELIGSSDVVTVTAALLEEKLRDKNPRCTLVRNGVDFAFFRERYQPSPILGDLEHPIIGFYGALAEWVDLGLLAEVARARPDWQLVLIGDVFVADLEGLDRLSNVHLLGRRPYDDMPRYLYHFDVCLIPFRLNQVTHAVDPVKFYEYISDGTPVVAVPLKELAIYEDYLYFAETPSAFVEGIEAALEENDPALRERRVALARANDWRDRYQRMDRAIVAATRRVSIIVVTYKNLELSQLCIESLLRNTTHPDYELIVVDNDSRDGTANYLRYMQERHERIKVIINDDNRGFAAANNQGLAIATGEDLVLLNNDTVTPRGWLAPLLKHLHDSGIGLVGPVTNFVGNEAKIEVPYNKVEEMEAFAREHMRGHAGQVFDIGVLAMFCVAMRREVYEQVGPLDETFGIGMFEDDDYSNRIRALGYRVVCAEDSFVHHFGQAAFKKLLETGEYHEIWAKNQAYYEQKWGKWKRHEHRS